VLATKKGTAIMTASTQMGERRELSAEQVDSVSGGFVMQTYAIAWAGAAGAFGLGVIAGGAIHILYAGASGPPSP
jgi:hypothetical protein